jgi:hypothetical protein
MFTTSKPRRETILPAAVLVFGVGLSTTWAILLASALVRLIEYAV